MVAVERRAVIDQPQLAVPPQQIGIARGAIHVRGEQIEPDDRGGFLGAHDMPGMHGVRKGCGQEVEPDVVAHAAHQQLLDLGVGLGAADGIVEREHHQLGHPQAERPRKLTDDHLSHERAPACPAPRSFTT